MAVFRRPCAAGHREMIVRQEEEIICKIAVGIPAEQIADQMGFTSRMVFQTERAEQKRNITLERLERMARALGCDLVYGLVPWERSLGDRAMELVEQGVWRKRYTTRRVSGSAWPHHKGGDRGTIP